MKKLYRTREGNIAGLDARTQLTTLMSEASPGPLLVPVGMTHIIGMIVSHVASQTVATGYGAFCRLEGPGLKNGPEAMTVGAGGNSIATGGVIASKPEYIKVGFPVIPGNEILIFGEMTGTDIGSLEMAITLVFADTLPANQKEVRTFLVEGDITAIDTRTQLTTQGSVSAPSPVVPAGVTHIDSMVVATASDGLADGYQAVLLRLGGNAVMGGEQTFTIGASARINVQSGSDAAAQNVEPVQFDELDVEVRASDTIAVSAEAGGVDVGTIRAVVTLLYAA